jgi:hypothetical protein
MSVGWTTTVVALLAMAGRKSRRCTRTVDVPEVSAVGRKMEVAKFNIAGGPSSGAG